MKRFVSIVLAVIMVFSVCVSAGAVDLRPQIDELRGKFLPGEGPVAGDYSVEYMYYSPVKEDDTTKYPLVVWFHGMGDGSYNGKQIDKNYVAFWASEEFQSRFGDVDGAFILAPRSREEYLNFWGTSMVLPARAAIDDGGVGFDYRLGMAIPDFWIKMLKDTPDEDWNIWEMWSILTNRLPEVKTVAYAESHDQALVGDKTIAFRLLDKLMYDSMDRKSESMVVDRGLALHKMIRLITITTGGDAYLNFMGNEFGHPEWIDFPREGNGWSYSHARRQWSLRDSEELRYGYLADFDQAMIELVKKNAILSDGYPYNLHMDEQNKTMVYTHRNLLFVFNWHPTASIPDYELPVREAGKYILQLSTDEEQYGGLGRQEIGAEHFSFNAETEDGAIQPKIKIYNTSRTAMVFRREE